MDVDITISNPTGEKPKKLTQEDVWGKKDEENSKHISGAMIIGKSKEKCPIWGDIIPYKSITVIFDASQEDAVIYWLEYVHGCDCVVDRKVLENNKLALRSDYQC